MAKTFKKRSYKKRSSKKGALKTKVRKIVKKAIAPLIPELKFIETPYAEAVVVPTAFNGAPLMKLFTSYAEQGFASGEFVGQEITLKYLKIRGAVYNGCTPDSSPAADTYHMRMIIVMDHQPMDENLILNGTTSSDGYEILHAANMDAMIQGHHDRFTVLWDKSWALVPRVSGQNQVFFSKKFNLGNRRLRTKTNLVTSGQYPYNHEIKVYVVSEASGGQFLWMNTRLAYTDA